LMHNNAIGPELCGKPSVPELDFYTSPYVDQSGRPLQGPDCWRYDPSVEGRYKLYKASMEQLLNPGKRMRKVLALDEDLVIDIAPKAELLGHTLGLTLRIPKGFPTVAVSSLRYKDLIQDLFLVARNRDQFEQKYQGILSDKQRDELGRGLVAIQERLVGQKRIALIQFALGKDDALVESAQARG